MVLDRSSHDLTSLTKADIYQVSGKPLLGLGHAHLRRIPSKVLTPFQDQPTVQGDPTPFQGDTPFQDQFTAQGDPHTLPGPVCLSEHVLPPLWQNQDYCFKAIYTVTLMRLHSVINFGSGLMVL